MQLPKHIKVGAGAGGVAVFGVLFGWIIFPSVLKSQMKKEMSLSPKTDLRQMWQKVPFGIDFKVYLFNYTNAEEVQKGATPIVQEIGPYYFEEWKEKVQTEDHEQEDTVTFKRKDTFYFKKELSGHGLTGEELIVMPHAFILAMGTIVYREKPGMLKVIGKAFDGIFDKPSDVFLRAKAMDIMFRGVNINCDRSEFAPKAVCTTLKKEAPSGIELGPNNQFKFSFFGTRNGTIDPHIIAVKRGIQNISDVGKIVEVDGMKELDIWEGSCNQYDGTDGTVFPPFVAASDLVVSYSPEFCRSFKAWSTTKSSYRGIKTQIFITKIGDIATDPKLQCYCGDKCPPKGLMELTRCIKAPMYASSPHFLDSDPSLLKNVKGLSPDVSKHGIELNFELFTGTPLEARQRMQFNIQLLKTDKLALFKNLPDTIVPLFWVEEGLALDKSFTNVLKNQLFTPKKVVRIISWLFLIFGILGVAAATAYHYKGTIMQGKASGDNSTKVSPAHAKEKDGGAIEIWST